MLEEPGADCPLCPRLSAFRAANRAQFPDRHNAPVPSFGPIEARVLIVGLAPGLKGANFTGRPFTADYAGDLLYPTLLKFGMARGTYHRRRDDGLELIDCRITNAVRCVPPLNKPLPEEIATCRGTFLVPEMAAMRNLRIVLSLGTISHNAMLAASGLRLSHYKFRHGAQHELPNGLKLFDSYHCSRYNTSTGVLTTDMFETVVRLVRDAVS